MGKFEVHIKEWRAVGAWTWNAGDDVCGICRMPFDGCAPDAKFPGDDSPVVWGKCGHAFHLQCIDKWLATQNAEPKCPMCRRPWEYKTAQGNSTPPPNTTRTPTRSRRAAGHG